MGKSVPLKSWCGDRFGGLTDGGVTLSILYKHALIFVESKTFAIESSYYSDKSVIMALFLG